jgi:hypothetical protein
MKRGTTITLNRREVKLLREKLTPDAEWAFGAAAVAEDVLRKLQDAENGRTGHEA